VYVAGGTYEEGDGGVPLADGVGVYGGYTPLTGTRSDAEVTVIRGSPQAALAEGDEGVVLQLLVLEGSPSGTGRSAYGLRAIALAVGPSRVALVKVTARGTGQNGGAGVAGTTGLPGNRGLNGAGCFPGGFLSGPGGSGGAGGAGGNAGAGIPGSPGGGLFGGAGGVFGAGGFGGAGSQGATGPNSIGPGTPDAAAWPGGRGANGSFGSPGGGGGGGRGGDGAVFACGGGGGGGGTGGGAGGGGQGGENGGGSFGLYLLNSSVVAVASTLTGGVGGAGGNGGTGGNGGVGGSPGLGGPESCALFGCSDPGFPGGPGGNGGRGGGGGGGTGGPSAGVYQAGPGSGVVSRDGTAIQHGAGGQGGIPQGTGVRAANGVAAALLRTPTAPEHSTADFDGDGITDAADSCPETARGGSDSNGDGCPDRPPLAVLSSPGAGGGAGGGGSAGAAGGGGTPLGPAPQATPPAPASRVRASIAASWRARGRTTRVTRLAIRSVPAGARIVAKCKGRGCPFRSKAVRPRRGAADLTPLFGRRPLRSGAVVEIRVTKAGWIGQIVRFAIRKGRPPAKALLCVPPAGGAARRTC
jgi:hypothetical protein